MLVGIVINNGKLILNKRWFVFITWYTYLQLPLRTVPRRHMVESTSLWKVQMFLQSLPAFCHIDSAEGLSCFILWLLEQVERLQLEPEE